MRGSPIRTSSDQRSVGSSPRLIAASYVLHRLLVPRHPPCALNNLATQLQQTPHPPGAGLAIKEDARVHCAVLNVQPATPGHAPAEPHHPPRPHPRPNTTMTGTRTPTAPTRDNQPHPPRALACTRPGGPLPQDPTACLQPPATTTPLHTPPQGGRRTGGSTGYRPNWSAFHPRALSRTPVTTR